MESDKEIFGKFLIENLRNTAVSGAKGLVDNAFQSPGHKEYQRLIATFDSKQKEILVRIVEYCTEGAINDFLYHLDEKMRKGGEIQVLVKGVPITELSPALYKELWGEGGWWATYGNDEYKKKQ